jgi:hypothetical protein
MRLVKTDRGYFDMDHVLHVGEPYQGPNGLYGFNVTLALRDKAVEMLYYPEDLPDTPEYYMGPDYSKKEQWVKDVLECVRRKRDEFVQLWSGEVPMIRTYMGKTAKELTREERQESITFMTNELKEGRQTVNAVREWRDDCERADREDQER